MPIFIVGFARSGTTLCQKLVSQHLGVPTLPETHYFEFLEDHEPAGGFIRPDAARELLRELERFLQIDVAALKPLLSRDEVPIRPLFLHLVGQQIGSQPVADKGQWIEKTPGHAEHLERIHQMFPKARFLCMVRDPVHAFASRRELQSTGRGWGEAWKPIEAFCAQWTEHVRNFRAFGERHPGQLMTIRLEDLAAQPAAELARVREFVGPGFALPIDAPLQPEIIQPFETWKRDALKPADSSIAERAGKGVLDEYETWRVKTLLREPMAAFGYAVDAQEPPGLDDLHRRTVASLDWYVEQFARRDALMDVKTTRIRNLLNEIAERNAPVGGPPPRPVAGPIAANPLLVARVGAPARNDATARGADTPPAPGGEGPGAEPEPGTSTLGKQRGSASTGAGPAAMGAARSGAVPLHAGAWAKGGAGRVEGIGNPPQGVAAGKSGREANAGGGRPAGGQPVGAPAAAGGAKGGGSAVPVGARPAGPLASPARMGASDAADGPSHLRAGDGTTASSGTAPIAASGMKAGGASGPFGMRAPEVGPGSGPGVRPGGGPLRAGGLRPGGAAGAGAKLGGAAHGPGKMSSSVPMDVFVQADDPTAGVTPKSSGMRSEGQGGGAGRHGGPGGKPGMRAGMRAGMRGGRPGARLNGSETHAQRQGRNFVVDNDGPLDDNLPATWRPLTLHGISGVNDNGETFLAEGAEIISRRADQPAGRSGGGTGEDITDAGEGA